MVRRLTHEEFMEKFYIKNENAENIEILSEYIKSNIKIKCKCKIDGHEWEVKPNNLLNGQGCPKCYNNKMKKTHEEFINDMKKINEDIEILGEYKGNKTKIKCKCKIDGHEWEVKPNDLLNGIGCPKCYNNRRGETQRLTHEEFINELKKINNDIEILGEYINNKTKIKCKCKIDGYEWKVRPSDLLKGQGCPKCYNNRRGDSLRKTHEKFINELKETNDNIEILGEYKGNKTKIKCRCKKDGYEWEVVPSSLLKGHGCPKCNESKGEKRVAEYLDSKNVEYERQYKFNDCRSKKELPFDFYIPSLNIAIEYDGIQHFKIVKHFGGLDDFIDTKIRDTIKTIYCKENNIKLIRIPYTEYNNIKKILEKEL